MLHPRRAPRAADAHLPQTARAARRGAWHVQARWLHAVTTPLACAPSPALPRSLALTPDTPSPTPRRYPPLAPNDQNVHPLSCPETSTHPTHTVHTSPAVHSSKGPRTSGPSTPTPSRPGALWAAADSKLIPPAIHAPCHGRAAR
eukprot:739232-Prymnesium_polylepis.1